MGKPRVLLADDHTLVVEAFRKLLENDFEIVGIVADGQTLLAMTTQMRPDVAVIDIAMPLLNGMDAGIELKKLVPQTKLIALTMNEDYQLAAEALRLWASAYLLKKSAASELVRAIHEVLKGKVYVTPKVAQHIFDDFVRDPRPEHIKNLTPRQRQVLQLLAEGRTMREAATILHVTTRTVAFHKYRIMEDFGLKTNADLVKFAIREHVLSLG